MSDILQEAETLIEKHDTSGYIHRDATLLLPGLVEEIKRLDKRETKTLQRFNNLLERCRHAEEELAKWQQIAIQQRALINFIETEERYAYSEHVILSDDEMSIAAEELGLQVAQEAGYLSRLEEAFIGEVTDALWMAGADHPNEKAQAALEKIRRG